MLRQTFNSVVYEIQASTSQRTHFVFVMYIDDEILCWGRVTVYCEDHTKRTSRLGDNIHSSLRVREVLRVRNYYWSLNYN
jgi:hypothetical protein